LPGAGRRFLLLLVLRQPLELIEEQQRVQRGDLEPLPARLADQLVVEPQQVIAELGELGAVALVGAGRQPILLHSTDPAHVVVAGPATARTGVLRGPGFRFFGEEGALVHLGLVGLVGRSGC
jgi:hypothetical protein